MKKLSKISVNVPRKPSKADKTALERILKTLLETQKSIGAALDEIETSEPLVPATADKVKKQRKITDRSRAAELRTWRNPASGESCTPTRQSWNG